MRISKVSENDIGLIAGLEAEIFTDSWSEKAIKDIAFNKNYLIMCAFSEDELLGYVIYMLMSEEAEVLRIAVKKDARNKGVAGALLDVILKRQADECRDVKFVFLEVRENNSPARKLYEKKGFAQVGVRKDYYSNPKENAIIYMMEID